MNLQVKFNLTFLNKFDQALDTLADEYKDITMTRRYKVYFRAVKTILYERARETIHETRKNKMAGKRFFKTRAYIRDILIVTKLFHIFINIESTNVLVSGKITLSI